MNTEATTNECYNEQFYQTIMMLEWIQELQRTVFIKQLWCYNEHRSYNERMLQRRVLSINSGWYDEHRCYNEQFYQWNQMLQKTQKLQQTNATTNSFIKQSLCYNKHRSYNERMLQWTVLSIKSGWYDEHRCYNEKFYQ
jgi:hypothetical protein